MRESKPSFRQLCAEHGLTVTHQRHVLYEVMQQMPGHPSPDEVYLRLRKRIPSISLDTVYKNIRLFLDSGILQEVSPHHGSLRVEMNDHAHHHRVLIVVNTASVGHQFPSALGLWGQWWEGIPNGFC